MEKKITDKKKPVVTEKQLMKAIDNYKEQLYNNKKISATKFDAMQVALYGCRCIIRDAFGIPRKSEAAWSK